MLTRKQHELLRFIQIRLEETGVSPSFEEMKDALDLKSKSGVHRLISALEERGFIRRLPNRARALEVIRSPEDIGGKAARPDAPYSSERSTQISAGGRVAPPSPANDVIELPLHGRIAAGAPIEALEGQTTLPVPAALLGSARDGEIVVALVRGEEATLKFLRRENGMVRLDPANTAYESQLYQPGEVIVQGKLAGLLRRYN